MEQKLNNMKKLVASIITEEGLELNVGFDCHQYFENEEHEDNPIPTKVPYYENYVMWAEYVINGQGVMLSAEDLKQPKIAKFCEDLVDEKADELYNKD